MMNPNLPILKIVFWEGLQNLSIRKIERWVFDGQVEPMLTYLPGAKVAAVTHRLDRSVGTLVPIATPM